MAYNEFTGCRYEVWDKKLKRMKRCGADCSHEDPLYIPDFARSKIGDNSITIHLCKEHREFVIDSLRSDYYIAKRKAKIQNKQKGLFDK